MLMLERPLSHYWTSPLSGGENWWLYYTVLYHRGWQKRPTFVHCLDKSRVVDVLAVWLLKLPAENLKVLFTDVQREEVQDAAKLVLGDITSVGFTLEGQRKREMLVITFLDTSNKNLSALQWSIQFIYFIWESNVQ